MFSNDCLPAGVAPEGSVYQRVLGAAFEDLDPQLRRYFGPIPAGFVGVGVGRFSEAGLRVRILRPVFTLLSVRGIAFAEYGVDVPFTVRNISRPHGTLHAIRTFHFPTVDRAMTDTMRLGNGRLVDRIGRRGEIEIEFVADVSGGKLLVESRRLALRIPGLRRPLPQLVKVRLEEEAGSRQDHAQHVRVSVTAPVLGQIYGYHGDLTYTVEPIAGGPAAS